MQRFAAGGEFQVHSNIATSESVRVFDLFQKPLCANCNGYIHIDRHVADIYTIFF